MPAVLLDTFQQQRFGLLRRVTRDLLKFCDLTIKDLTDFLSFPCDILLVLCNAFFFLLDSLEFAVHVFFLLNHSSFRALDLGPSLANLLLHVAPHFMRFFFCF